MTSDGIQSIFNVMSGYGDPSGSGESDDYGICTSFFYDENEFAGGDVVGGYHPGFFEDTLGQDDRLKSNVSYSSTDAYTALNNSTDWDIGDTGMLTSEWDTIFNTMPLYMWNPRSGHTEPLPSMPSAIGTATFIQIAGTGTYAQLEDLGHEAVTGAALHAYQTITGISDTYLAEAGANCVNDAMLKYYIRLMTGIDVSESGFPLFPAAECLRPGVEASNVIGWTWASDPDAVTQIDTKGQSSGQAGYGVHDTMRYWSPVALKEWSQHGLDTGQGDTGLWATQSLDRYVDNDSPLIDWTATQVSLDSGGKQSVKGMIRGLKAAIESFMLKGTPSVGAQGDELTENQKQAVSELPIVGMSGYMCKIVLPKLFEKTMAIMIDPSDFVPYELSVAYDGDDNPIGYEQNEITSDAYESKLFGFYATVELFQESS